MRRHIALAGALGIAGAIATGAPAHAEPTNAAQAQVQAAKTSCWMTVSPRIIIKKKKTTKQNWRDVTPVAWASQPKLCKGKIITVGYAFKYSKNGAWHEGGRIRQKMYSSFKSYPGGLTSFKCGQYVYTEYRLDGVTWAGKTYQVCKGN